MRVYDVPVDIFGRQSLRIRETIRNTIDSQVLEPVKRRGREVPGPFSDIEPRGAHTEKYPIHRNRRWSRTDVTLPY